MLFLVVLLFQETVPYKNNEEFEVTLDYQIKPYTADPQKAVDYTKERQSPESMFFLTTRVKIKKLSADEVRVQVASNLENMKINRKTQQDMVLKIEFGFIEDVKNGTNAHEYTVNLISADKQKISRIYLLIDKDGTFFVNGQKRGKF